MRKILMKKIAVGLLAFVSIASANETRTVYQRVPSIMADNGDRITFSLEDLEGDRFFVSQCTPEYRGETITDFHGIIRGYYHDDKKQADNPKDLAVMSYKGNTSFEQYIECIRTSDILSRTTRENPVKLTFSDDGILEKIEVVTLSTN